MKRTLHIHDHRDIQDTVTIRCLAVVSAVTTAGYWHFQVKYVALHDGVVGSFAEPSKVRFRSCFRVARDCLRHSIHCHVDYLLGDCDIFWRDLKEKTIFTHLLALSSNRVDQAHIVARVR